MPADSTAAATGRDARADALRGIVLMVGSMSLIAVVDAIAKLLGQGLPGIQVTWGYFAGIAASLLVYRIVRRQSLVSLVVTNRFRLQLLRAVCLVGSLGFLFTGLKYLPLAEATTISFTSPLFVVALSGPLLGERIGPHRWGAVLVGLVGAVIVVRPGSGLFQWVALLPLVGAVFFAVFQIVTRWLGTVDDKMTTLFMTAGGGAAMLLLAMPFVWVMPDLEQFALFALMGVLGLGAHLCLIHAFALGDVSMLAPFNYTRLVWALALGLLWFGQFPDAVTLVGAAVIAASGLYVLYRETRAPRRS